MYIYICMCTRKYTYAYIQIYTCKCVHMLVDSHILVDSLFLFLFLAYLVHAQRPTQSNWCASMQILSYHTLKGRLDAGNLGRKKERNTFHRMKHMVARSLCLSRARSLCLSLSLCFCFARAMTPPRPPSISFSHSLAISLFLSRPLSR